MKRMGPTCRMMQGGFNRKAAPSYKLGVPTAAEKGNLMTQTIS